MSLQGLALLKCFITLIALKRLLPCVCSLVRYQMCILGKSPSPPHIPDNFTSNRNWHQVLLVNFMAHYFNGTEKISQNGFSRTLAYTCTDAPHCASCDVFQVWFGAKTLGTYGALVGLLTCKHAQVTILLTVQTHLADHTFSFINICSSTRYY